MFGKIRSLEQRRKQILEKNKQNSPFFISSKNNKTNNFSQNVNSSQTTNNNTPRNSQIPKHSQNNFSKNSIPSSNGNLTPTQKVSKEKEFEEEKNNSQFFNNSFKNVNNNTPPSSQVNSFNNSLFSTSQSQKNISKNNQNFFQKRDKFVDKKLNQVTFPSSNSHNEISPLSSPVGSLSGAPLLSDSQISVDDQELQNKTRKQPLQQTSQNKESPTKKLKIVPPSSDNNLTITPPNSGNLNNPFSQFENPKKKKTKFLDD